MGNVLKTILGKVKIHNTRNKLLMALIALTVISLISVGAVISVKVFYKTKQDYMERVNQNLKYIDSIIDNYIYGTEEDVKMMSELPIIKKADARITTYVDKKGPNGIIKMKPLEGSQYQAEIYHMFEAYLKSHPSIFTCSLGVEENGGFIQYPARDRYDGYDARTRAWYKQAVENPGKVGFSEAYTTSTGQWVIYVVKTVVGEDGKRKGVLSIDINLSDLTSKLKGISIGEYGYIVITDTKGNILAHTKDKKLIGESIYKTGIKNIAKAGDLNRKPFEEKLKDGREYWVDITDSSNPYVKFHCLTFVEKSMFAQSAKNILEIIIISIIMFTLIAIIIAFILASRIARPINLIAKQARKIAELDVKQDISPSFIKRKDEVGILANSLQGIIDNLRAFIRQTEESSEELERKVKMRTMELERAMDILVENEKFAFLGELVGGVAHEINTPIGVSVTTASYLEELNLKYDDLLSQGKMTKVDLKNFFTEIDEGIRILNNNLRRASELIASFKQIAVDQSIEELETFSLREHVSMLITSLKHEYKNSNHQLHIDCDEALMIRSYPGIYSQILSNLIMNSIIHGFKDKMNGNITIALQRYGEGIRIHYFDDGCGISEENISKIYDAFFTTNKHKGGSGLGMNIVYNLVTHKLKGSITCTSKLGEGTSFVIEITEPVCIEQK